MFFRSIRQNCIKFLPVMTSNTKIAPVKLAYNLFKPAQGPDKSLPPMIFMHGVTSSKETWCDVPQRIADKTKRLAYAIDARNHGDTEWTDVMDFENGMADVFHFMDSINAPKAILIGHSLGGMVAAHMALSQPKKVEKLISEDAFLKKLPKENFETMKKCMLMWREAITKMPKGLVQPDQTRFVVDYYCSKLNGNSLGLTSKECLYNYPLTMKQMPDNTYDVKYNIKVLQKAMENPDCFTWEPRGIYKGQAYFLYGELSTMKMHEDEILIRKFFPKANLVKFEGANHNLHLELSDKFVDTVVRCIGH